MRVSVLIPCHNEQAGIAACVRSCLLQTRPPDEIIVVNDGSTDRSGEILDSFGDLIRHVRRSPASGNKSYAQELGLRFVTGDVFITTDGDTELHPEFVERAVADFERFPEAAALGGYIQSQRHNWLTSCRAFEYAIGQNLHKLAQHHLGYLFVIPGPAGVFRSDIFREYIAFEHDTLTEDLDFTYRLHAHDLPILYDDRLVVYTQDPATIHSYINQMRRWFGGGWQCLLKHRGLITRKPRIALELSMIYMEGTLFAILLFVLPLLNLALFVRLIGLYLLLLFGFALFASIRERRVDLLFIPPLYVLIVAINAYLLIEQGIQEMLLGRRERKWFQPERFVRRRAAK